jgi:protein SCO1/2
MTQMRFARVLLLSVAASYPSWAGCGSPPERTAPAASAQAPQAEQKVFDLVGKVVDIDKERKTLTVDHQDIPGFMGAMTMPYAVKDVALLERVSPGDQITAKVVSGSGGYWLENIAVTK